jgi:hypothetical protein
MGHTPGATTTLTRTRVGIRMTRRDTMILPGIRLKMTLSPYHIMT